MNDIFLFIFYSFKIEIPKKNAIKEKKESFEGCSSKLFGIDFYFNFDKVLFTGFNKCCNNHDLCYSTCNIPKKQCDNTFKKCLFEKCGELMDRNKASNFANGICKETAKAMFAVADELGCPAYGKAQKQQCVC